MGCELLEKEQIEEKFKLQSPNLRFFRQKLLNTHRHFDEFSSQNRKVSKVADKKTR